MSRRVQWRYVLRYSIVPSAGLWHLIRQLRLKLGDPRPQLGDLRLLLMQCARRVLLCLAPDQLGQLGDLRLDRQVELLLLVEDRVEVQLAQVRGQVEARLF